MIRAVALTMNTQGKGVVVVVSSGSEESGYAELEALGEDTDRIEFVVENTGYMPTYGMERAVEGKVTREVMAETHLPEEASLIQGNFSENPGHVSGRNTAPATSFLNDGVTVVGGRAQRAVIEWVVNVPKGTDITLIAKQTRSGIVRAVVSCE